MAYLARHSIPVYNRIGMALKFSINLSMLYTEFPFMDRFSKAAEAGFEAVEVLFPSEWDAEQIKSRPDNLGLTLALINLPMGGPGEIGLLGIPEKKDAFRCSFETSLDLTAQAGVTLR